MSGRTEGRPANGKVQPEKVRGAAIVLILLLSIRFVMEVRQYLRDLEVPTTLRSLLLVGCRPSTQMAASRLLHGTRGGFAGKRNAI